MPDKIPYLFERNDALYFRRRVPKRFHALAGCTEWKAALGRRKGGLTQTLLELRLLAETTDAALAALHRNETVSAALVQNALSALYPERRPVNRLTIRDAGGRYAEANGLDKLGKAERMAIDQFIPFAGSRPLGRIDRKLVKGWVAWLRTERRQSEATIRRRLGSMSALFGAAAEAEEQDLPNPFSRHKLRTCGDGFRLPFQKSHLATLDCWLSGRAGDRPTGRIIRLLRSTGARPLEIGGLMAEDIRLDAPTPFLILQPNALRGLKTPNSRRILPLVDGGLAAAHQLLAETRAGALFPPTCHETGSLSARLNKALRAAGVPKSKRLTAYSFRHTVEEALRVTDAPFDVQQAILGHAKRTSTERYGARHVSLARMRAALEKASRAMGTAEDEDGDHARSFVQPRNEDPAFLVSGRST